MLNFIQNNTIILSALEQFELLTMPKTRCHFLKSVPIFFPRELINNLSFSFFISMFTLWAAFDLKELEENKMRKTKKNNLVNGLLKEINNKKVTIITCLNTNNTTKNNVFVFWNNELKELAEGSMFLIYKLVMYIYTQIFSNLQYFKPVYLNYVLGLFIYLFMFNFYGMIPFSLTLTSYFILTLNLSGMSFFGNLFIGLRTHGLIFFKFFIPQGVTGPLIILLVIIELISYIARLFSMAIRLFANMLSGHALVKILSGLIFLTFEGNIFMGITSIAFNLIILAVIALEFVVATLQTYVFTVLSVIYTNESIILH